MLRLLIISILLVAVNTEYNVDEFKGNWLPVVTYPKRDAINPNCRWFNFKIAESLRCTCGDIETPVMSIGINGEQIDTKKFPIIVIGEIENADAKLKKCVCPYKQIEIHQYPIVLKKFSENYFVAYSAQSHGAVVDYSTAVFVRKVPRLSELQAVLHSLPDLHGKEPGYLCPQSSFAL